MPVTCPYCNQPAELVTGADIYRYREDLAHLSFWKCAGCDAYVGCHKGTETPLGTLADEETRVARSRLHATFDPLWRERILFKSRKKAYAWLADQLKIPVDQCHIGLFNKQQCQFVMLLLLNRGGGRFKGTGQVTKLFEELRL